MRLRPKISVSSKRYERKGEAERQHARKREVIHILNLRNGFPSEGDVRQRRCGERRAAVPAHREDRGVATDPVAAREGSA